MWPFKKPAPAPAPAPVAPTQEPECIHVWDKWSKPIATEVERTLYNYGYSSLAETKKYKGWAQDRYCLRCNIIERRTA